MNNSPDWGGLDLFSSNDQSATRQFLNHVPCDECGSKDNKVKLIDEAGRITYYCHTPGCEDKSPPSDEAEHTVDATSFKPASTHFKPTKGSRVTVKTACRGIPTNIFNKFGVKTCDDGILFPFIEGRKLVAQKTKTSYGYKYNKPGSVKEYELPLFGSNILTPSKNVPLIITEGYFDCMSVKFVTSYSVVSIAGGCGSAVKQLKHWISWLNEWNSVYILFDNDARNAKGNVGQNSAKDCQKLLLKSGIHCGIIVPPANTDPNDMLIDGKLEELKELIDSAKYVSPPNPEEVKFNDVFHLLKYSIIPMKKLMSEKENIKHDGEITNLIYTIGLDNVIANPYKIMYCFPDLDFGKIDKHAWEFGIKPYDINRLREGVLYKMACIGQFGLVEKNKLIKRATEYLRYDIESLLEQMLKSKHLFQYEIDGRNYLETALTNKLNKVVARELRRIDKHARTGTLNEDIIEEKLKAIHEEFGWMLNEEQKVMTRSAFEHPITAIQGLAGSGKSSGADLINRCAIAQGLETCLVAYTGCASKVLGEFLRHTYSTIHSAAKLVPKTDYLPLCTVRMLKGDLIIVDECSMINLWLFAGLLLAVPSGARLVLMGDVGQIQAVASRCAVFRDIISSGVANYTELVEGHRQNNSDIIEVCEGVREGKVSKLLTTPTDVDEIPESGVVFIESSSDEDINDKVDYIVRIKLKERGVTHKDILILSTMKSKKQNLSTHTINIRAQMLWNQDPRLINLFKVGDPVMQHNSDRRSLRDENGNHVEILNGETGIIKYLDYRKAIIKIGKHMVVYWNSQIRNCKIALNYARTLYKSQGAQAKVVILALTDKQKQLLKNDVFYVGLSRAIDLLIIIGTKEIVTHGIENIDKRITVLEDEIIITFCS